MKPDMDNLLTAFRICSVLANRARTSRNAVMLSAESFISTTFVSSMLAALATGSRSLFTVFGEIARVMFGPFAAGTAALGAVLAGATVAGLTALAAGFGSPFAIIGEVAGAVPAADMTGARSLIAILGEVPGITGTTFFCHGVSSFLRVGSLRVFCTRR
jgi:hypothetical protein